MDHIILKGKGELQNIAELIMSKRNDFTNGSLKIHRKTGAGEFILLIFEKYYLRNKSRSTLTVTLHQDGSDVVVDTVGSGGASGMFLNISLGANYEFVMSIADILKPVGFVIEEEEEDQ